MEAEVDHPHQGRFRKRLACIFESCGRFNVNLQSTQNEVPTHVGRGEKPFPNSASFRCRHQLLQFQIFEGIPATLFDFYGDLFWGTLYLVWRGDVFGRCTKRSNFNESQSWGFEEGWGEIESFVLLKDFMGNHLHKRCI